MRENRYNVTLLKCKHLHTATFVPPTFSVPCQTLISSIPRASVHKLRFSVSSTCLRNQRSLEQHRASIIPFSALVCPETRILSGEWHNSVAQNALSTTLNFCLVPSSIVSLSLSRFDDISHQKETEKSSVASSFFHRCCN